MYDVTGSNLGLNQTGTNAYLDDLTNENNDNPDAPYARHYTPPQ